MFIFPSGSTTYQITNSVRFRANASAYLSRTPGVAGNSKLLAGRYRIKRGSLGSLQVIASAGTASIDRFYFDSSDRLCLDVLGTVRLVTTPVYRDPGSHYVDVGFQLDVANGTAALRAKILINGTEVAAYSTDTRSAITNTNTNWNATVVHYLGRDNAGNYFDGYISEPIGVDGSTLSNYSFQDTLTGAFAPLAPSATYGTNGFYLKFNDGSNLTNLCLDRSGNGNNWTATGVSLTVGITYDWMTDTPMNNYCVMNNVMPNQGGNNLVFQVANLDVGDNATNTVRAGGATFSLSTGKWTWEVTVGANVPSLLYLGINQDSAAKNFQKTSGSVVYYQSDGQKDIGGTNSAYGASYAAGDVIRFEYDADAGILTCFKNGTSQGAIYSSGGGKAWIPAMYMDNAGVGVTHFDSFNFGQRPFAGTPTAGFKTLCTQNLPTPTIKKGALYFNTALHTGNGSTQNVTGLAFQPDLVWVKSRSAATDHKLTDSVRGVQKGLISNGSGAETTDTNGLTAFLSNGFALGSDTNYNNNTATYVDWCWKAGGAAVTNNAGSISSQVSANVTAGISVVTYTGTGVNATVGHGLGVAPKMVIVKDRTDAATNWGTWQTTLAGTEFLLLNSTAAKATGAAYWNSTVPTSSLLSVGTSGDTNANTKNYVAYCFAEVAGFSKFGSYIGNGNANGPFVWCGFMPRYIMAKLTSSAGGNWVILDSARDAFNVGGRELLPNAASAEAGPGLADLYVDFTSNGFKLRGTRGDINNNGATYIFAAFAETPFNYANAR